jgi:hypothetical protein
MTSRAGGIFLTVGLGARRDTSVSSGCQTRLSFNSAVQLLRPRRQGCAPPWKSRPYYSNMIFRWLCVTFVSSYLFPGLALDTECRRVMGIGRLHGIGLSAIGHGNEVIDSAHWRRSSCFTSKSGRREVNTSKLLGRGFESSRKARRTHHGDGVHSLENSCVGRQGPTSTKAIATD